ncbi:alpha/beta fold hydrolase BchO [Ruegeria profundi]|uniref:alpha/beta fold hydrolase BchO n=1 Tax=Ruegeria profundi TaxID=1685378 RepID=UPI001CD7BCF7|nr:alpha/beta fold hydrolase BchO [Ruegeria profundi]MCA0928486.1 alpha/beta fold hydrolase [Ruegeria profundi]
MDWQRDLPTWPHHTWSKRVVCAPHRWHVQEHGEGPTLLFLHGAGASTHSWNAMMTNLAKDHHVVAIDLPGHGFTVMGANNRSGLETMAEDIAALCTQENWQPTKIVAHSAGAAIALQLCEKHLTTHGKPSILAINPAFSDFDGLAGILFPIIAKSLAVNPLTPWLFTRGPDALARAQRLIASTGSTIPAEQLALYARLLKNRRHVQGALFMMAQWSLRDFKRCMSKSQTPIEIIVGLNDRAVPPETTASLQKTMPNSNLTKLADLGHLAHEEAPDLFVSRVRSMG